MARPWGTEQDTIQPPIPGRRWQWREPLQHKPIPSLSGPVKRLSFGADWVVAATTPQPTVGRPCLWTGVEAIVWGGDIDFAYGKPDVYLDVGGRYDPYSDTWAAITPRVEPERPVFDAAVWTGSEVVAWGRTYEPWARFDPIADLWQPTSTTGAPLSSYRWRRLAFGVVWTDIELILWGGLTRTNRHNTGARYNPVTDSWVDTSTTDAPMARDGHSMVWAEEIGLMLVWGDRWGSTVGEVLNDGGRYDPATDSWTPITTQNAPTGGGITAQFGPELRSSSGVERPNRVGGTIPARTHG